MAGVISQGVILHHLITGQILCYSRMVGEWTRKWLILECILHSYFLVIYLNTEVPLWNGKKSLDYGTKRQCE